MSYPYFQKKVEIFNHLMYPLDTKQWIALMDGKQVILRDTVIHFDLKRTVIFTIFLFISLFIGAYFEQFIGAGFIFGGMLIYSYIMGRYASKRVNRKVQIFISVRKGIYGESCWELRDVTPIFV